jgi:hypothetical protein
MAFKNDMADDMAPVGHSVWPRQAPRLAPCLAPVGPPVWPPVRYPIQHPIRHPIRHPVQHPSGIPFAFLPDILIFSGRFCHPSPRPAPPSGTMIWSRRFGKRSSCPPSDLPHPALSSSTPLGTLVSSRGSGRPSISEPLDRCPFGPSTVALPYTYIKPSTPPLHHFLHSPNRIGTCDCVATAALRGSW